MGLLTQGVMYLLIGLLAFRAAIGAGAAQGARGAISEIARQPFGRIVLGLIALGFVAYALWRVFQAALDPYRKGHSLVGLLVRIGYLGGGAIYGSLAWWAAVLAIGWAAPRSDERAEIEWTAWLMSFPFGIWLVAVVGALVVGIGCGQFFQAYAVRFMDEYDRYRMTPIEIRWCRRLGRIGYAARGVVFLIAGGFLIGAAWHANPREAIGLKGALEALAARSFGPWLLGLVALGLLTFGIFCFTGARYRRFPRP